MSEDLTHGPSGINPNDDWIAKVYVPRGRFIRMTFNFNAAWENMLWVCSGSTGERLAVRGNYFRETEEWVTPIDRGNDIWYAVVGYHKLTSPDDGNAGGYPWRQSPMRFLGRSAHPDQDVYGFNDEGGNSYENSVVYFVYVGEE
jgi:hypothetical protein